MTKIIEIIIAPNGQTRVETKGFAGGECQQNRDPYPAGAAHGLARD
jgi:hypothetical protein